MKHWFVSCFHNQESDYFIICLSCNGILPKGQTALLHQNVHIIDTYYLTSSDMVIIIGAKVRTGDVYKEQQRLRNLPEIAPL